MTHFGQNFKQLDMRGSLTSQEINKLFLNCSFLQVTKFLRKLNDTWFVKTKYLYLAADDLAQHLPNVHVSKHMM